MHRNALLHAQPIAPDLWGELREERLLRRDAPVPH
jgi:hypothetical protein